MMVRTLQITLPLMLSQYSKEADEDYLDEEDGEQDGTGKIDCSFNQKAAAHNRS